MKNTIILLLVFAITACSKDNLKSDDTKTCWECNILHDNPKREVRCSTDGVKPEFKDPNGQAYITYNCKKV